MVIFFPAKGNFSAKRYGAFVSFSFSFKFSFIFRNWERIKISKFFVFKQLLYYGLIKHIANIFCGLLNVLSTLAKFIFILQHHLIEIKF